MKYLLSFILATLLLSCQQTPVKAPAPPPVNHVVVIYMENHSFYNLFAEFPGVDQSLPVDYRGQVDAHGQLYKTLPFVKERNGKKPDPRFPKNLPNQTFLINYYAKVSEKVPDPMHEFYLHQMQIDGGKMDRFALHSYVGALTMGYYDMKKTHLWKYAQEYTLADHFFQSAFGGSFINHQWIIAARTPPYPKAPKNLYTVLNSDGSMKRLGLLTTDGYAVNTIQPFAAPYDPKTPKLRDRLPAITYQNIGDLLSQKKISWAWYAGGWNEILKGHDVQNFQYHHQPFSYFANYGPGTEGRKEHLKDEDDLFAAIQSNNLPQVAFFKPVGVENAHPGYSDVSSGDEKMNKIIQAIQASPAWPNTLIIVTFDEHGGFWDPKAPPVVDRWGPGSRIPAIFISPQVKSHYIDHTQYESTSILAYLEKKYDLPALSNRDAHANPLTGIFK